MELGKTTIFLLSAYLAFGVILGAFFNSATPTFYPSGTLVPLTTTCDFLSTFFHTCLPALPLALGLGNGTFVFNLDIIIIFISFSSAILVIFVLNKREEK